MLRPVQVNVMKTGGRHRFVQGLLQARSERLQALVENDGEAMGEVTLNHILGLDGPNTLNRPQTETDRFVSDLFFGFHEVYTSFETLEDIHVYLKRSRFSGTSVAPERYLRFLIESHLSEVYVFQERWKVHVTQLKRKYKTDPASVEIRELCQQVLKLLGQALEPLIRVRGQHVHKVRFSHEGLERLESIALLRRHPDDRVRRLMATHYKGEYRKVRGDLLQWVATANKTIGHLLDTFCDALFPIAFEPGTNRLRCPGRTSTSRREARGSK